MIFKPTRFLVLCVFAGALAPVFIRAIGDNTFGWACLLVASGCLGVFSQLD